MKDTTKKTLLDWAEVIDAHRIVPKIIMLGYAYMCWDVYIWTLANSELDSSKWILAAVFGIAGILTGAYFGSGRKWNKTP